MSVAIYHLNYKMVLNIIFIMALNYLTTQLGPTRFGIKGMWL